MLVERALLVIELVIVVRVHLEMVESEFLLDALLEGETLLNSQSISLGDDRHNVDNIRQLLQDNNVNGLERVSRGLDEEEAAVNTGVLDVALSLGGELLAQVSGVLILDVLDDGVPASVIVNEVAITGGIDNVESQADTVLLNDVGGSLDLGRGSDGLFRLETTLGIDKVRSEDGVDQG